MVVTSSSMLELGSHIPDFSLLSTDSQNYTSAQVMGKQGLLVAFICNHCPFVIHIAERFAALADDLQEKGIGVVGINSNDTDKYPEDNFDRMIEEKAKRGYKFPYLIDPSQDVARAFRAACTPDFFLFQKSGKLFYRGRMDASRPGNSEACDGSDIYSAAAAMTGGEAPPVEQHPSMGCNIKWRDSN